MASRFSIGFLLFILACCVTFSSAAVASWQEEFEMKMEAKMNKIETKNVQLEEKVTQLEAQLELNVRTFHFLLSFLVQSIHLINFCVLRNTTERTKNSTGGKSPRTRNDFKFLVASE
jgi:hypothetical protein